jgi:wobble nucleotide-excising tRNase
MIETIKIDQVATYSNRQTMAGLKDINFVFGTNGAGKTTIGRVIAQKSKPEHEKCSIVWRKGIEMQPLVYNRDFVDANFNLEENLKGIFTLGEKDIANELAIKEKKEEVDRYSKEIAQHTNTLGDTAQKSGKRKELAELEGDFKERCWAQKRKHDDAFAEAFTGVRNDAVRFKERVLQQQRSNMADSQTIEYLTERAVTVFDKAPQRQIKVPTLDFARIVALEAEPILAKKVVGKEDVDIAKMIHRIGHSDWVKIGQSHFKTSAPECPFCQQKAPEGLTASLESYFDETFQQDTQAIADLQATYDREKTSLLIALNAIAESTSIFLDKEAFEHEKSVIDAKLRANAIILVNKKKEPSTPQQLESLADPLSAVFDLVAVTNAKVHEYNGIVDGISSEKTKLVAQVWRYILDDMKADLETYSRKKTGLDAAIENLKKQIKTAEEAKAKAELDLRELEKTATTVQPTVDAINDLLKSFGFKTFTLAKVGNQQHYKLVRHDGKDAKHTLSEGEKSFVTFLYFYHLIKGSDSESGVARDRVVVFDDPVSSMDSDVLFIVSSLIRALFDDMNNGRGYVKQVFILTHNVYFHKEVSFVSPQRKKGRVKSGNFAEHKLGRTYWVVRKSPTGPIIEHSEENPVKTSYDFLWDEVRKDERNPLTIQNTMRRILEHYFKILGGVDFDDLCEKFDGREKLVFRSLLSWVNDGSHFSHDDAHFAFGQDAIDDQVEIFKKIFELSGHLPHYDMMMAKK